VCVSGCVGVRARVCVSRSHTECFLSELLLPGIHLYFFIFYFLLSVAETHARRVTNRRLISNSGVAGEEEEEEEAVGGLLAGILNVSTPKAGCGKCILIFMFSPYLSTNIS